MRLSLEQIISTAQNRRASDIHISCGIPIRFRIDGRLVNMDEQVLTGDDCEFYAAYLSKNYREIARIGEQDFAVTLSGGIRCRVNLFRQRGNVSAAIRILNNHIPTFEELNLPPVVKTFANFNNGIVLVTGETGAGKSTTLASILDIINHSQDKHIVTLEDPIEYIYDSDRCIISQREIGLDTRSYQDGLNAILREDPDVILIGEMRNLSTIETALMAAETGHLVFATLHTNSAADTIDRIVNVFPATQQQQVRTQLSMCMRAVVCQQLLPHMSGLGRILATEVMVTNSAIRNLIREGKTAQINNAMVTSAEIGNQTMDSNLIQLYITRKISKDTAVHAAHDREYVRRAVQY